MNPQLYLLIRILIALVSACDRAGALVQWLKLPAWTVGDRGFETHAGCQVSSRRFSWPGLAYMCTKVA